MFRIGIVGAGKLSQVHLRHLARIPDVEVTLFDRNIERSQEVAAAFKAQVATTFDDLLGQVDAIDIITPNFVHAEYAVAAIKAGKHVFIEKPIEVSWKSAQPICEAAAEANVVATVGHVLRHFRMYRKAHDLVKAGEIGKPAAVRMHRTGLMPGGVNNWFGDHALSGGVFIDLAVHDFDWLLWTLGPAKSVFARSIGATTGQGKDYGLATIEFQNGCLAHVEASWMETDGGRMAFEVCGSDGMLEYDTRNVPTLRFGHTLEQLHLPEDDPFYLQLLNFVKACQGEDVEIITVAEACEALRLADACLESAKTGQLVNL